MNDSEPQAILLSPVSDHDLLIELRSDMKSVKNEVREINDNTKGTLNDHETRLRSIERWMWMAIGAIAFGEVIMGWYIKIHF